ncbi:hypothetical protein ACI1US_00196 [Leucobacter sp. BZR 635]
MRESHTVTQIDPTLPVMWESETTLRVGFDRAVARVVAASPAAQRVTARLMRGATDEELSSRDPRVSRQVLAALAPALVTRNVSVQASPEQPRSPPPPQRLRRAPAPTQMTQPPPQPPQPPRPPPAPLFRQAIRTRISDDGREVNRLRASLSARHLCSFVRGAAPELAVEVLRFLEPLGRTSRWLTSRTPHLLIRFTDEAARVGPLVAPRGSPCHGCETLNLIDSDPALPAIAAQLYGGVPGSENPEVSALVSAVATYVVQAWRRREAWVHTHQLTLPVRRGTLAGLPTLTEIAVHPECSCAISNESRPPPQTVTGDERHGQRSQSQKGATHRAHG